MTCGEKAEPPMRYCRNGGARVVPSDRFCGSCGSRIAPVTPEDPQVIPEPVAAARGAEARSSGRFLVLTGVMGIALVLLVGGGALAFAGLGFGFGPFAPAAPPDPAFDPLLKTLRSRTDVPVMLPAELPKELKNVAIDQDVKGDGYRILFLTGPPDGATAPYVRVYTNATLTVISEYQTEPNKLFQAASAEDVRLPDGTEAQLRYMVPEGGGGQLRTILGGHVRRGRIHL